VSEANCSNVPFNGIPQHGIGKACMAEITIYHLDVLYVNPLRQRMRCLYFSHGKNTKFPNIFVFLPR
jgi:hypothetical protein